MITRYAFLSHSRMLSLGLLLGLLAGAKEVQAAPSPASMINVRDYGAIGDGTAPDTIALQNAFAAANTAGKGIYLPPGVYRCATTLVINGALGVYGDGAFASTSFSPPVVSYRTGSWLLFDHPGVGIRVASTSAVVGLSFDSFGTKRNQPTPPAPGTAWTPANYDFDFTIETPNGDTTFSNLMLLNPTRGILGNGRVNLFNIRGQPLKIGVQLDKCNDVVRIENVHFWPFWVLNDEVRKYTLSNASAFIFKWVDNPVMSNVFVH